MSANDFISFIYLDTRELSYLTICLVHAILKCIKRSFIDLQKYKIIQKDTNGDIIEIFPSLAAAGRAMNKKQTKYIKECCEGLRKEMYGYIWEYTQGGI